jgi:hypothetical protein
MALLRSVIERAGGTVVGTVSPQTSLVVDAGSPPQSVVERGPAGVWRQSDEKRRKEAVDRARDVGARVVGLDTLLDVLGVDRSALSAATLAPTTDGGRPATAPAPARSRDPAVAY